MRVAQVGKKFVLFNLKFDDFAFKGHTMRQTNSVAHPQAVVTTVTHASQVLCSLFLLRFKCCTQALSLVAVYATYPTRLILNWITLTMRGEADHRGEFYSLAFLHFRCAQCSVLTRLCSLRVQGPYIEFCIV